MWPGSKNRFGVLDAVLLVALAAGLWALLGGEGGQGYDWSWSIIGSSLVREDGSPNLLLLGLFNTLRLSLGAMVLAMVMGLAAGMALASQSPLLKLVARGYVELIRNLPPLPLIFIFYFFLGDQILTAVGLEDAMYGLPGWAQNMVEVVAAPAGFVTQFASALLTLALYEGAYVAEIVRAGIQSVEKGQWEAAYALGLSRTARMRHVILPQALRRTVPPLAGQFISTIKDSSIVSVISIPELTFQAMEIMASTGRTLEIWSTVLVLYLSVCLACSLGARRLERILAQDGA